MIGSKVWHYYDSCQLVFEQELTLLAPTPRTIDQQYPVLAGSCRGAILDRASSLQAPLKAPIRNCYLDLRIS